MTQPDTLALAARNKSRYLQAKDAFNRNDIEACLAFYSPDHRVVSNPGAPGRAAIRAFLEQSHQAWPDLRIVVEHVVAEGDRVMGRSVATATHTATVLGVAPTGKRIEATFWDLHRFDDEGLILETWNLMDTLSIMRQLGIV